MPETKRAEIARVVGAVLKRLLEWNSEHAMLDDGDFVPLLDQIMRAAADEAGDSSLEPELLDLALGAYHATCLKSDPDATLREDRKLFLSYLPASRRRAFAEHATPPDPRRRRRRKSEDEPLAPTPDPDGDAT